MNNVATIVCAVDLSDHSTVALARAGAWARFFRARLLVVTVAEPLLVDAAAAAYGTDLVPADIETVVAIGPAVEKIAETTVVRDVGLIVMGLRNQGTCSDSGHGPSRIAF
jgi:hypothetical protein